MPKQFAKRGRKQTRFPKDVDRPSIFLVPRLPSPLVSPFCARVQISQDPLCVGFTPNEKLEVC